MSFAPQVKYSKLMDMDTVKKSDAFNFDSVFTFDEEQKKYGPRSKDNYNSAFKYSNMEEGQQKDNLALDIDLRQESKPSAVLIITTYILTFLSYIFFAITMPITYWIFVKKMGEFDRVVVYRLGKMIGVKGPGRVLIFPWMDRMKKIDVRAAAFSVPPQQLISCDGGIVEIGAEIQYGICDLVTMNNEIMDHQDILRSLSKTLLIKLLVKKTVSKIEKEKRLLASEIQDEMNLQVRKWGLDVQKVELSEPKVLKQPENGGNTAVGSILKGLGMKSESKFPTPEEFVHSSYGIENENSSKASELGVGGANMSVSLLQMMGSGLSHQATRSTGFPAIDSSQEEGPEVCGWGHSLEVILQSEFNGPMDEEACGLYKLEITDTEIGTDVYFISLSQDSKTIMSGNETNGVHPDGCQPDVTVNLRSPDLASILEGTLEPLQAYLAGRISASGDIRKLMLFDRLSKRGHKPGTMFNV